MQLDIFKNKIKEYHELDNISFLPTNSKKMVIERLQDISIQKRKIQNTINDFIDSVIVPFEQKESLSEEDIINLKEFLNTFSNETLSEDYGMFFRVHRLLLKYAQANLDDSSILEEIYYTGFGEYNLQKIIEEKNFSYFRMALDYIEKYDSLSTNGKIYLMKCLGNIALENKWDYKTSFFALDFIKKQKEIEPGIIPYDKFISVIERNLSSMLTVIRVLDTIHSSPEKYSYSILKGIDYNEVDDKTREYIYEAMKNIYDNGFHYNNYSLSRVNEIYNFYMAEFATKRIDLETLVSKLETLANSEYTSAKEKITAMCSTNALIITFLRVYGNLTDEEINRIGRKKIKQVKEYLKTIPENKYTASMDMDLFNFMVGTSQALSFNNIKKNLFHSMIYAHKSTYIHTAMVAKISSILVKRILEKYPEFLVGIMDDYKLDDIKVHSKDIINAMRDMSNLHDIGKYRVINVIRLSYRKLMDEEFKIIQYHPLNGSGFFLGNVPNYIREGIECHHLWYNRQFGYPKLFEPKSNNNKPLVDILSVADTIDAATDNIGRPYNLAKTYDEILAELDTYLDTRYSSVVVSLLHDCDTARKIKRVITEERKEIYYKTWTR